jgi:hypothetical protein
MKRLSIIVPLSIAIIFLLLGPPAVRLLISTNLATNLI